MIRKPAVDAPADTTVLTHGPTGFRLMRKGTDGQWRNMMGRARVAPRWYWDLPDPDQP